MSEFQNYNPNENNYNGSYHYTNADLIKRDREARKRKAREKRKTSAKLLAAILAAGIGGSALTYAGTSTMISAQATAAAQAAVSEAQENNTGSTPSLTTTQLTSSESTAAEGSVADVAATAMKSLVTISTTSVGEMRSYFGGSQQYEYASAGSGVIISEDDSSIYIATNYHVIENAESLSVGFSDDSTADASLVGSDTSTDLAVISVSKSDVSSDTLNAIAIATIGDSDALVLGDQVVAIGNALGYGQSVTSGYISAFDRSLTLTYNSGDSFTSDGLIQTDAAINSGNSGGGLFNMNGELIAINEAKSGSTSSGTTVDNMGFAIPMSKASSILQSIIDGTFTSSSSSTGDAYLGVSVSEITEQASQMYNLPSGVYISGVADGSPAAYAGLMQGDIITAIDGTSVSSYDDLTATLGTRQAGDTVTLTVSRANYGVYESVQISATLGSKTEANS